MPFPLTALPLRTIQSLDSVGVSAPTGIFHPVACAIQSTVPGISGCSATREDSMKGYVLVALPLRMADTTARPASSGDSFGRSNAPMAGMRLADPGLLVQYSLKVWLRMTSHTQTLVANRSARRDAVRPRSPHRAVEYTVAPLMAETDAGLCTFTMVPALAFKKWGNTALEHQMDAMNGADSANVTSSGGISTSDRHRPSPALLMNTSMRPCVATTESTVRFTAS